MFCLVVIHVGEMEAEGGGGFAVAKEEKGREGVGVTESREIVEGWMGESKTKQPFL